MLAYAGHQMMGRRWGKVRKAEVGWCVGVHSFRLLQKEEMDGAAGERIQAADAVPGSGTELPPDNRVLAQAPDCRWACLPLEILCWAFRRT